MSATTDGGRTWVERQLPKTVLGGPDMWVPAPGLVVISVHGGWYLSTDGAATFHHEPARNDSAYLPEEVVARGPDALWADGDCTPEPCFQLVEHTSAGDRVVSLAGQPITTPEAATYGPDGRWWIFSRDGSTLHAAVSSDRGVTWQAREVLPYPGLSAAPASMYGLRTHNRAEAWLAVDPGGAALGHFGEAAPAPVWRKQQDLPLFWLLRGDRWVPQPGTGQPASSALDSRSWIAAGGQMILVGGQHGVAALDASWTPLPLPTPVNYVGGLFDGGIVAGVRGEPAPSYLGTLTGRQITWVKLDLTVREQANGPG